MNLYIIIVTYNGMKWLKKCLDSCAMYKVVVVDNASSDGTVDFVAKNYGNVHLIESQENLGFGKANNIGMTYALSQNAESVFLLNQDAYLVDDVLDKLFEFQQKHKDYGIVSPIHLEGTKTQMDFQFSNYVSGTKNPFFYSDHVLGNDLKPVYEVSFINAAAWMISKICLEKVGGFDPLFFHYSEDNNYCQRVLYHGLKIGVVPKTFIIHDREQVKSQKIEPYSPKFFIWKERIYKTKIADVNNANPLNTYKAELKEIKKSLFKAFLQLKLGNVNGLLKLNRKLKALKEPMLKSYHTNRTSKMHYL